MYQHRISIGLLVVACTLAFSARASNDGKLCEGPGILLCAPLFLGVEVTKALTPKTPSEQLWSAIETGDLDSVKRLIKLGDPMQDPVTVLKSAAANYLGSDDRFDDPKKILARFHVIQYLLDEVVDVSAEKGTPYLQMTIERYSKYSSPPEKTWPQRLALAKLLFAHGASAKAVVLSDCEDCATDNEFLPLMVAHGANPDSRSRINPALLDILLSRDKFDAAQRLVRLGADPNGSGWGGRSMLCEIARRCDVKAMRARLSPQRFEAESASCIAQSTARTAYAIQQLGADPNGRATAVVHCVTPYEMARAVENDPLAETLLKLGASPDYAERCRGGGESPVTQP